MRDKMLAREPMAPNTARTVEVICTTSPEKHFPARAYIRLLPLLAGGQAAVFSPCTVFMSEMQSTERFHGFHYRKFAQACQRISVCGFCRAAGAAENFNFQEMKA